MSIPDLDVLRQLKPYRDEAPPDSRIVKGTVARAWTCAPQPVGSIEAEMTAGRYSVAAAHAKMPTP